MKKLRYGIISVLLLAAMLALCIAPATAFSDIAYSNTTQLTDSLSYTQTLARLGSSKVQTYSLSLTPGGDITPIVLANDTIYGGMTIQNAISYAEKQGYNVVAALNSDFFSSSAIPTGVVVEDGIYKSSPEWNSVYGFNADGTAFIENYPTVNIKVGINGESFTMQHFNKMRSNGGGLYLFSSAFSTVSTRTSTDGWMVRLKIKDGKPTVSGTMTLEVTELIEGKSAVPIGDDYLILTADTTSNMHYIFEKFSVGDEVTITTTCSSEALINAEWAGGGGDVIVKDGAVTSGWNNAAGSNPRSAIGVKADGSSVFLVADGRTSASAGLTLTQLANELLSQGCVAAINLDGGGSSVMALRKPGESSCSIISNPSDGSARSCAEYILLVANSASTGEAQHLYLAQDGAYVLAGSSLSLSYTAMDSAYKPASAGEVTAESGGLGSVTDNVYTAGGTAGVDAIALSNGTASGSGSIHVVTSVDTLSVTNASTGKSVSSVTLDRGGSISLKSAMYLNSRSVAFDSSAVTYSVTGGIGTITEDGVFTAADTPGASGSIVVTGGGLTKTIPVTINKRFNDISGHWAETYINSLYDAGIINGTSANTFSPSGDIKRGDFVLMLYRAAGEPSAEITSDFSDVTADKYYAKAISWAYKNGIINGTGGGKFSPEATLTREQAFTIVYRALPVLSKPVPSGVDVSATLSQFADSGSLASYAREATAGLVRLGIINGDGGSLNPSEKLTRAQTAKILYSVLDL